MTDRFDAIGEKLKDFAGNWASYSVAGSFALYLLGYLALRFHLTALGIGTDMNVLDERYFFTGAKCLVYLVSAAATVVFLGLLLAMPTYGVYRLLAVISRGRSTSGLAALWRWLTAPYRLALIGLFFSSAFIQLMMKDCFLFGNLLLRDKLPENSILSVWLLQADGGRIDFYFYGLVCAALLSGAMLLTACTDFQQNAVPSWSKWLLGFMVGVQWLLLPVNFGYLVMDKQIPVVASLEGAASVSREDETWLAWENKEYLTFLKIYKSGNSTKRSLLTLPRAQIKTIEIIGYKPIFQTLFSQPQPVSNNDQKH